jgi:hypothetical protein
MIPFSVLFLASAACAQLLPALERVDNATIQLGVANENFQPSNPATAGPINIDVLMLKVKLDLATFDAKWSKPYSAADAASVIDYFRQRLNPDTEFTIGTLEANKAAIEQSGFLPVVQGELGNLRMSVDNLVKTIALGMPKGDKAQAEEVLGQYDGFYQQAVEFFCST